MYSSERRKPAAHRIFLFLAPILAIGALESQSACGAGVPAGDIHYAPRFSTEQLSELPTSGWITNGGNLSNWRYSPLDSINRSNVSKLKAVWRASLGGSGIIPQGSNQAEPLYYDGTVYIATSQNDVFAIDVDTGKVVWKYAAHLNPALTHPCCGWAVRGLSMGDGKIFMGRLDATLVAIDQKTGKVVWSVQEGDPRESYSITSAPRYYDGLVLTGTSGGVMGTRGRLSAYDARNGKLVWRFYTIPGPGEFGHDTWPKGSDVWKYGGAAVWQTPAIDPDLGLIYFSTSNPGPVLDGAVRAGDNLFSSSIVAIDAKTGKYRWHFQEVHHDLWDYDASNPIILFDAVIGGRLRKGLAQGGKTGWVYILDRVTGKPLLGIEEKPVMQEPRQKTSPTQPMPVGDPIVPQFIDIQPEGYPLVNGGRVFTPYADKPHMWKPFAGINWPPSSYDPATHLMYICAQDGFWGATGDGPTYPIKPDGVYSGGVVYPGNGTHRGIFAALDVTTNRIVWRQQWPDQCYSGSITTRGGLVFVGRNDGRLLALDKTNGDKLWEFQTDGGVNSPAITFERHGKQYVVAYAGGTLLAPSKRSDGVWMFSLDGTIGPLPPGSAAAAPRMRGRAGSGPGANPIPNRVPNAANGGKIFASTCVTCHGETGKGGTHGGKPLTAVLTPEAVRTILTNGRNAMPAFGSAMSEPDLEDLIAYVMKLVGK